MIGKRILSFCLAAAMTLSLATAIVFPASAAEITPPTEGVVGSIEFSNTDSTAGKITGTVKVTAGKPNVNKIEVVAMAKPANDNWWMFSSSYVGRGNDASEIARAIGGANEGVYYCAGVTLDDPNNATQGTFSFTVPSSTTSSVGYFDDTVGNVGYNQSGGIEIMFFTHTNDQTAWRLIGTYTLPQTGRIPAAQVTITWEEQGGTTATGGPNTVGQGEKLGSVPSTTKAGYYFLGWFDAETGGNEVTKDTLGPSSGTTVTYYAHWAKNYTLTFDSNGGGTPPAAETHYEGEVITTLPGVGSMSNPGKVFGGWATSATGSAVTSYTMPSADSALYAVWGAGTPLTWNGPESITDTYAPGDPTTTTAATYTVTNPSPYGGTITYASSDTSVVTVDNNGNVTIKGAGTATITVTATADGIYSAPAPATVNVTINKATATAPTVNNSKKADSAGSYNNGEITVGNYSSDSLNDQGGVEYVKAASAPASGGGTASTDTITGRSNGQYWVRTAGNDDYEPSDWVGVYVNSTFNVTYNANGGSWTSGSAPAAKTVSTSGSDSVALGSLVTDGSELTPSDGTKKFGGWSMAADTNPVTATIPINSDTTLTAIWSDLAASNPQVDGNVTANTYNIDKNYGDAKFTPSYTRTGTGAQSWGTSDDAIVDVDAGTGELTVKGVGTATITYSVAATDTHAAGSVVFTVTVSPKTLTASDIDWSGVSFSAMTYNGKTNTDIDMANVSGTPSIKSASLVNSSDTVTLNVAEYTRNTSKANASGEQVNVELTLTDPSGKYVLDSGINDTAFDTGKTIVVNKVKLTVADVQIEKVYNGTNTLEADDTTAITGAALTGLISGDTVTLDASGVTYLNSGKVTTTTSDGGYDVLKAANQLTLIGAEADNYEIDSSATGAGRILGKVTPASLGNVTMAATNTTYNTASGQATVTLDPSITLTGTPTITYKVVNDTTATVDATNWATVGSGSYATVAADGKLTGVRATGNTGDLALVPGTPDPTSIAVWAQVSLDNYETKYIKAEFQVEKAEQTLTSNPSAVNDLYTENTKPLALTSNASSDTGFDWTKVEAKSGDITKVTTDANANASGEVTLTGVAETAAGTPAVITIKSPATANYKEKTVTVDVKVLKSGGNGLELKTGEDTQDLEYGDTLNVAGLLDLTTENNTTGEITYASSDPAKVSIDTNTGAATVLDHEGPVTITITQAAGKDSSNNPVEGKELTVTLNLSKRVIEVSGTVTAENRRYNGTTDVTITTLPSALTITNVVTGDNLALGGSFSGTITDGNPNVDTSKPVTLGFGSVSLTSTTPGVADHYTFDGTDWPDVTVNITKAKYVSGWDTGDATSATKAYTGAKTGATLTLAGKTLNGVTVGSNTEVLKLIPSTDEAKKKVDYVANVTHPGATTWDAGDDYSYVVTYGHFTVDTANSTADPNNYETPADLTYENGKITPVKVTVELSGVNTTQTYGDGPFTLSATVKDEGGTVRNNVGTITYTVTKTDGTATDVASLTGSDVLKILKSGEFKVTATLTPATGNYTVDAPATLTCTVAKMELEIKAPDNVLNEKIAKGNEGKPLVDINFVKVPTTPSTLKTLAAAGATLSYAIDTTASNTATARIESGNVLKWDHLGSPDGATATIKVTMTDNPYYTLKQPATINLRVTENDPADITFTPATFTYNGEKRTYDEIKSKLKVTVPGTGASISHEEGDFAFTYSLLDSDGNPVVGQTDLPNLPKDAGTYSVTATFDDGNYSATTNGKITINKAPVTIQVADTTKTYGASTVTWGAISIKTDYTLQGAADQAAAATILGNLTLASAGTDADKEIGRYDITVTDGNPAKNYEWTVDSTCKLEVTKKDITVTVTASKPYDGNNTIGDTSTVTVTFGTGEVANNDDLGSDPLTINKNLLKYNTKNVHTGLDLTGTLKLAGAAAKNYNLTTTLGDHTCTGTITRITGVTVHLKPATTISGNTIKLSDVITAEGLIPSDTPNALVTKPDGTEDWSYNEHGGYTSTSGVIATVYEKQPDGTYAPITGNPTSGKTYYVDVYVPTGDLGNYTVTGGHGAIPSVAPANEDDANDGTKYCKVTVSSAPTTPIVSYVAGEHGKLAEGSQNYEFVRFGEKPVNVPEVEPDEGYRFAGWSTDGGKTFVKPNEVEVTGSITYTAIFEEDSEHIAYMIGRGDKQFVPNGNLTRAEAAAILARLSPDFSESKEYGCTFTDVNRGVWFYNYIAFCQTKGIVIGNGDNTFRPDSSISRAELAAMVVRFLDVNPSAWKCTFTDVSEKHWANGYIAVLQRLGIVKGDGNGKFRPGDPITRYETTILINRAINRTPDPNLNLKDGGYRNPFSDITEAQWYYEDVVEATVDHNAKDFHRDPVTGDTTDSLPGTSRSREDDKDKDKDSKKEENATEPKVD